MSVTKETPVSAPPRRCIRIVVFFMLQTKGEQTCSPALPMHAREGAVLTARCTRGARSCTDGLLVFSEVFSALAIGISWWILVRHAFKPPEVINFSLVVFSPLLLSASPLCQGHWLWPYYGCPGQLSFLPTPHPLPGLSILSLQHELCLRVCTAEPLPALGFPIWFIEFYVSLTNGTYWILPRIFFF